MPSNIWPKVLSAWNDLIEEAWEERYKTWKCIRDAFSRGKLQLINLIKFHNSLIEAAQASETGSVEMLEPDGDIVMDGAFDGNDKELQVGQSRWRRAQMKITTHI